MDPTFKLPNFLANQATCQKFWGLYEECLVTLHETFPECLQTKETLEGYRSRLKSHESQQVTQLQQWHRDMTSLYTRADQHDPTLWKDLPLFQSLDLDAKLRDSGLDPNSVSILWEYVDGMTRHARIYNAIPSPMLDKIQSTAMDYVQKVQSGEMKLDLENLNWDVIKNMGQTLMSNIEQKDLHEFTQNLTGLASNLKINNIQDVFKLMGDIPGLGEVMNNNQNMSGLLEQLIQSQGSPPQPPNPQ